MKKLLSILTSFTILISLTTVPVGFANTTIVIPTETESSLTNIQLESIKNFLEDYQIVTRCLRNKAGQEDEKMTLGMAICSIFQVFDPKNVTSNTAWTKAKRLGLITEKSKQTEVMKGIDFLSIVFKTAGITISPLQEAEYKKLFVKVRLRLNKDQSRTLAIALEQGLIPEPRNQSDARMLKNTLVKKPLTVADALGILYQISLSNHSEIPVININTGTSTGRPVVLESVLKEIVETIKTQSYFKESFDEKAAMEAAIKALVKSLEEDKYIEYYTEEEYESFSSGLNGNLEGIGAYLEEKDGKIEVISPIEGGPADRAGIRAGDILLKINDVSIVGLSLQQVITKIRGPEGTEVKLTVKRAGAILDITITREMINVPSVITTSRDGIEIIHIVQFGANVANEVLVKLKAIQLKNPQGIVIDLRNDPGGFLNEVVTIVNFFLEKNKTVVVLADHQDQIPITTSTEPIIRNIPISVLINKGSASASEILAGALQSYGVAKIYGETSYGKGTVQNIITMQDPGLNEISAFKLTTSEYLIGNPNGAPISINGIGVKPSNNPGGPNEPLLDDETTPEDEALDKVVEIMKSGGTIR